MKYSRFPTLLDSVQFCKIERSCGKYSESVNDEILARYRRR